MKTVVIYLLCVLVILASAIVYPLVNGFPVSLKALEVPYNCCLVGGLGGVIYCLRAVYLNRCVRNSWSPEWEIWYFIRPIVSSLAGGISYIFLKAGLLVLEASESAESSNYGFLALAFVAGLNVDNFVKKIEEIASSTWGIRQSRSSRDESEE